MPVIMVEMWQGYSIEQKRQLARDLTESFVKIGVPAADVQVIFRETPKSCWADAGKLCSDFEVPPGA
jgi:4-oxalocrotonate tautomerase